MPVSDETKNEIIRNMCRTHKGWLTITASMMQTIRFDFAINLREVNPLLKGETPDHNLTKQFTAQPSAEGLKLACDKILQWMQAEMGLTPTTADPPHLQDIHLDELIPAAEEGEPLGAKFTAEITWRYTP